MKEARHHVRMTHTQDGQSFIAGRKSYETRNANNKREQRVTFYLPHDYLMSSAHLRVQVFGELGTHLECSWAKRKFERLPC